MLTSLRLQEADLEGVDVGAIGRSFDPQTLSRIVESLDAERPDLGLDDPLSRNGDRDARTADAWTSIVRPGESIQEVVDAAPSGGTVFIRPGTYVQTVTIDKPLLLVGLGRPGSVVIEDPGGESNGITARDVSGVGLINLTVRGFSNNGVFFVNVDGFLLFRMFTDQLGEGAYGLFPVRSRNGLIARCTATGADDAGIYVGQSENVAVVHNEAFGNVIGFEAENMKQTVWAQNRSHDNAAGMLAILLPPGGFISVTHAEQMLVAHNRFTGNNGENFAESGDLASFVPSGTGLLVIGYDDSVIRRNRVTGNTFVGIGLGSALTMLQIAGRLPDDLNELGIEPHPDNVRIVRNQVTGNGTAPSFLPLPPVDLLWDRPLYDDYGSGNCWTRNVYTTSFPEELPACE